MPQLSSLAQKLTEQNRIEVETAVCKIFRNPGKNRQSVGQGCLVKIDQPNDCCVVTANTVIPDGQVDAYEVEFTKKNSKQKQFFLKDIKKEVKYVSGLAIISIDLNSSELKHGNKTCSIFNKSPVTITALDKTKQQFCYIDRNRFEVIGNNNTIEFPVAPSTVPNGLVILQTSNSTDNSVNAVGIQRQQMMTTWIHEILEAGQAPATSSSTVAIDAETIANGVLAAGHVSSYSNQDSSATTIAPDTSSMSESANPESTNGGTCTASNQTQPNGDQQSLAAAAGSPGGSHGHNSQSTEGMPSPDLVYSGVPQQINGQQMRVGPNDDHETSLTSHPIQVEPVHTSGDDDCDTGQRVKTATENYEHYLVSEKIAEDSTLQHKLVVRLNATSSIIISNWENLACTEIIKAPLEVCLKCKINSANRCTMTLFEVVAAEQEDKTVKDFIDALTTIKRYAVKKTIMASHPDAANSTEKFSEFIANPDNRKLLAEIATHLDQNSQVNQNWFELGVQFGLSYDRLNEMKYFPCMQAIMGYIYTKNTDLTMGQFYEVVKKLKRPRHDVLKILDPFTVEEEDRRKLMKDVIPLESDTMRAICVCLNNPNPALDNWKHVAKSPELGIPENVFKGCTPERPKSPMETLLEWIYNERADLTIGQLCEALASIHRNDIIEEIRKHFQQVTPAQQHPD